MHKASLDKWKFFFPKNVYIFLSRTAKKSFVLVETAIFYGPLKLGLFPQDRVNWRLGLVTPFQAYHRVAPILSQSILLTLLRSVAFVLFFDEKEKKYCLVTFIYMVALQCFIQRLAAVG